MLEQLAEDARVHDAALRREARHETLLGRAEFEIQENFFFSGAYPKAVDGPLSAESTPPIAREGTFFSAYRDLQSPVRAE